MKWRNTTKLSENVYWVGIRDWNRRLFDALIPLPKGTSYNAYLVIGKNKTALIDTVNPGFEKELKEKIHTLVDPSEIDYVIMNHAEPDHAGAIPYIMRLSPKAKLVTTTKGAKMAQIFYNVPEERIIAVKDQETIDLGGKTLRFIEAPMLHWPETMFTYLQEDKILFPCDFFGSHLAKGQYDDEVEDLLVHAQRYWGEIMMPFAVMAKRALEKIKDLEIKMIAPSHGPIHRNPERIRNAYYKWANGETKQKAIIVYVTMWNSTEKMIQAIADTLASEGIQIVVHNLALSDIRDVAKDLVDSKAIVLGAPTVLGGAHPLAVYASYLVKALKPPLKFAVVLSSYGWGGGTIKQVQEVLGPSKIEVVGALEVNGPPTENDISKIVELGKTLAGKIKETP
ncbi:MAG: FprA family A-type flavoprotein [Candidatus Bathyarchaeia archaeon]|nr:FprA family A-type flavoprotein [Candidatus Bathyarchaeota archaeon A05DMB-5]